MKNSKNDTTVCTICAHSNSVTSYSQVAGLKIVLHDFDQIVKKHLNIQNDHESKKYIDLFHPYNLIGNGASFSSASNEQCIKAEMPLKIIILTQLS